MSGAPAVDTVALALSVARQRGVPRLDALALLSDVLACPRSWLLAHDDAPLALAARARYGDLLARRAAGEPLAYLLGTKEFFGLALAVTPDVLVPRPETETLVEWALELLPVDRVAAVVDLGTGSGAIALALAQQRPQARVIAIDSSAPALAIAAANGLSHGLAVEWLPSDWFGALAGRRFDVIVSNPPYIATGDAHLQALTHEPRQALTSGPDGLDAIRHLVGAAPAHLQAAGWLLLEHGHDQAPAVQALLADAGFGEVRTRRDLAGLPRCTGGRLA
ncbi:peptide chain release factor N(5)-glutamine methyltransferase [uncultured Methylibium sp.]|uniref:peptide chain release factor N(5)-glutamine methyltransferase n=1 Tax=uncultured Methylibium sp. TaxID=381093 RepID=UPI0025D2D7FE|nr:peptide chain release factor N(5)-glutamine methyltransferase [uncultured Methylibium sp.]